MEKITREQYIKYFNDNTNHGNYRLNVFVDRGVLEFSFEETQDFLNKHGYILQLKEYRVKVNTSHSATPHYVDQIYGVTIAKLVSETLPEILSKEQEEYYNVNRVFKRVLREQLLRL